jgi:hypothetical protein
MNIFSRILKTLGPRVIGSIVAGACTWIGVKTHSIVNIDPDQATTYALGVTGVLLGYAGGHRATSAVINPGDAASARVSDAIKDAADASSTVRVQPK